MKTKWFLLGAASVLVLGLIMGFAVASPGSGSGQGMGPGMMGNTTGWEAMHDAPGMQQMHDQMMAGLPDDFAAQCEVMHEQMDEVMDEARMMGGGSGMMGGGSGMMGGGSGMMGGGSGMMGSGG